MIPSTDTAGASGISSGAVLGWERGCWHPSQSSGRFAGEGHHWRGLCRRGAAGEPGNRAGKVSVAVQRWHGAFSSRSQFKPVPQGRLGLTSISPALWLPHGCQRTWALAPNSQSSLELPTEINGVFTLTPLSVSP